VLLEFQGFPLITSTVIIGSVYAPRSRSLFVGDLVGLDLIDRVIDIISDTSVSLTWAFPFFIP
jgi:hypothetical protein